MPCGRRDRWSEKGADRLAERLVKLTRHQDAPALDTLAAYLDLNIKVGGKPFDGKGGK